MALILCPDCSQSISDQAKTCPNCGRSMVYWTFGRVILGIVVGLILFSIIIFAFSYC